MLNGNVAIAKVDSGTFVTSYLLPKHRKLGVARVGSFFFFFQAEDGIRDVAVTGVQTCALPISDLGLRATYRDGEQLRPIRRLAANSGHGSPWKDPGRSRTGADWIRGRAGRDCFWNESDCLEPEHDARGRQGRGGNPGFQGPAVRAGRHPDDPFGVEQSYARPGRGRGAGENEANGPVDQCVARADRRRASFDQRVEEQANRRRSEEHTSELQSRLHLVCRLLLEKKKNNTTISSATTRPTNAKLGAATNMLPI